MAYTQADLDRLQAAIAKGARRVRMNGEEVEFRDLNEMERIEAKIMREISTTNKSRIIHVSTVSGWR
jgi:hypothetical protein